MTGKSANSGAGDASREAADLADYLSEETTSLPPLLEPEEAAIRMLALYEESGREGATFSLRFGDLRGQSLFAVSLYPERSLKLSGYTVEMDTLQLFIQVNKDLLNDPRCGVGLWYYADVIYCDIVALLPNEEEAVALAKRYDQIAIFDLRALTEIETNGTGNTPATMPPGAQRLPKINLEEEHL